MQSIGAELLVVPAPKHVEGGRAIDDGLGVTIYSVQSLDRARKLGKGHRLFPILCAGVVSQEVALLVDPSAVWHANGGGSYCNRCGK